MRLSRACALANGVRLWQSIVCISDGLTDGLWLLWLYNKHIGLQEVNTTFIELHMRYADEVLGLRLNLVVYSTGCALVDSACGVCALLCSVFPFGGDASQRYQ